METTKDFAYAFGWNAFYQKILGNFSMKGEGLIARQRGSFVILITLLSIWLPSAASLAIFWGDMNACIECLSTTMPTGVSIAKTIVLQYHRDVTGSVLLKIMDDWKGVKTKEEYKIMLGMAKVSRFISIVSVSLTNMMFFAYIAARVWISLHNPSKDSRLASGLLHDSYYPFNTSKLSIFAPLWIGQFFGTFLGMISYAGPDCLVSMIVLHLCGQIKIIRHSLKCLVNETTLQKPEIYWKNMTEIVKRHEQLNQVSLEIRDTFSTILLVQILVCSVTFCFQCYAMFTTLMDRNGEPFPILDVTFSILYGIYTIIHLFIYCYVGDNLYVESTSIADDFYETAWYELAPREAKAFLFVCHRSKIPLEVMAGKFCTFNLQLFNSIMKSSMGYLSMLMAMKERLGE